MSSGQWLVTVYFIVFYLIPMIGNRLFGDDIVTIYDVKPLTGVAIATTIGTFVLFLLMSSGPKLRFFPVGTLSGARRAIDALGLIYRRQRLSVALIALALAIPYVASGLSSYRYSSVSISESGSILGLLVILINLIVSVDLFYCMFVRPAERLRVFSRRYVENVLLALVLVVTANGTGSMLIALIAMGYSLWPAWFHRILFMPRSLSLVKKMRRMFLAAALGTMVFITAWTAGEIIKISASTQYPGLASASVAFRNLVVDSPELVESYGYYLVSAVSSWGYYSALFTANTSPEVLRADAASALMHPLQSLLFRLNYMLGTPFDVPRPEYGSLSRVNYVLTTTEQRISPRQGTSPGLVASFDYAFVFPFNIILGAIYLCLVARLANRLLSAHRDESLSAIGMGLLLLFMLIFFQSPFDFLQVFDTAVLYVVLIALLIPPRQRSIAEEGSQHIENTSNATY